MLSFLVAICLVQDPDDKYPKPVADDLKKVQKFLAEADEITTFAADRVLDRDQRITELRSNLLAGKPVLRASLGQQKDSRTAVLKGKDRKLAVEFFQELTKPPIHGPAKCFFPRHSLIARKGEKWIDIQICYECVTMTIRSNDKKLDLYLGINRDSRTQADKFFGYVSKNSKA